MSVYYKFTSAKSYNKIPCDGLSVDILTLKQEISSQLHLKGFGVDFDLEVTNETSEVYSELDKVPRNAKVQLARKPITKKINAPAPPVVNPIASTSGYIPGTTVTTNDLQDLVASIPGLNPNQEEEKQKTEDQLLQDMFNAAEETSKRNMPSQNSTQVKRMKGELPPPNYVCYKCGLKNHWIYDCPNSTEEGNVRRVQRATGIPKSMLSVIDKVPEKGIQELAENTTGGELMVTGDGCSD